MFEDNEIFQQSMSELTINQWQSLKHSPLNDDCCYVLLSHDSGQLSIPATLLKCLSDLPLTAVIKLKPHSELPAALALKVASDLSVVKTQLGDFLTPNPAIEVNVFNSPPSITKPGLLVMDMDSTAIKIECIDEIARLAGVYDEVANVTKQAMQGALPFSDSLKQRVAKLDGVSLELMQTLKESLPLMPGVKALCQHLKNHGWQLAIASGGFIPFAEQVQLLLELDAIHANTLEDDGNALTGRVLGTIVDAEEKARFLNQYASEQGIDIAQTIAMGDGANDLLMMQASSLGVAVHGKPLVAKSADVAINFGSLLQVLYFISIPTE